jgi:hypothetical protein
MDDVGSRLFEFLLDEVNRMLVMFAIATVLGVGSVVLFFYSPGDSPTRVHLGLLVCAAAILFYLTLRSSPA